MLWFGYLGKTKIPHRKNTADMPAVRITPPAEVLIPTSQHIGAPATPIVKIGDEVKVGQKIAEASGYVSSPIYASVSGKVTKIENYLRPDGREVPAIRIVSDGNMEATEFTPPVINDLEDLVSAIRESGMVGLGGAGFPTSVKFDAVKRGSIDTIILNGAECEPYITSDTRTMLDKADLIRSGIEIFRQFMPSIKSYIIGIENNKPECIAKMNETFADIDEVSVISLPSAYPQGGEKVIIYNTTRRTVPEGKLPADVGVVVINVTSLATIAQYLTTGVPLIEKCITVDGSAVSTPANVIAPIGTPISHILNFIGGLNQSASSDGSSKEHTDKLVGGLKEPVGKVLYGGPMMGVAASSLDEPIAKTTNAITILSVKDSTRAPVTACIHCGRCVAACPMHLNPTEFAKALNLDSREERVARLEEYKLGICIECGCCSYVCPANRPLVQNNRIGKAEIRDYKSHLATLKGPSSSPDKVAGN